MSSNLAAQRVERPGSVVSKITHTVVMPCRLGMHLRVATSVVRCAKRFSSAIRFQFGTREVDAKSILNVLTLGMKRGDTARIEARGHDAERAMADLTCLFANAQSLCLGNR